MLLLETYPIGSYERNIIIITSFIYGISLLVIIGIEQFLDARQEGALKSSAKSLDNKYFHKSVKMKELRENGYIGGSSLLIGLFFFFGLGFSWYTEGGFWKESTIDEFNFALGGSFLIGYGIHTLIFNVASLYKDIIRQGNADKIPISESYNMVIRKNGSSAPPSPISYSLEKKAERSLSSRDKILLGKTRIVWTSIDTIMVISVILYPLVSMLYAYVRKVWITTLVVGVTLLLLLILFYYQARKTYSKTSLSAQFVWEIFQLIFTIVMIFLIWMAFQSFIPESSMRGYKSGLILVETFALVGIVSKKSNKRRMKAFCKKNPDHKMCRK